MFRRFRSRLTYANVVASLALFIALGGISYGSAGAVVHLITGAGIKNSSVTGADIRNSSLTGSDVKNKSLTAADFSGSIRGPAGPKGPAGPQGTVGISGAIGATGATGADATKLFATVEVAPGAATLARGSGVLSVTRLGAGLVTVKFNQNVTACAWLTSPGAADAHVAPFVITTAELRTSSDPTELQIRIRDLSGAAVDAAFHLGVLC